MTNRGEENIGKIIKGIKRLEICDFDAKGETMEEIQAELEKKYKIKINKIFATTRCERHFGWFVFYK